MSFGGWLSGMVGGRLSDIIGGLYHVYLSRKLSTAYCPTLTPHQFGPGAVWFSRKSLGDIARFLSLRTKETAFVGDLVHESIKYRRRGLNGEFPQVMDRGMRFTFFRG